MSFIGDAFDYAEGRLAYGARAGAHVLQEGADLLDPGARPRASVPWWAWAALAYLLVKGGRRR